MKRRHGLKSVKTAHTTAVRLWKQSGADTKKNAGAACSAGLLLNEKVRAPRMSSALYAHRVELVPLYSNPIMSATDFFTE